MENHRVTDFNIRIAFCLHENQ